jgi:hypothetical protein
MKVAIYKTPIIAAMTCWAFFAHAQKEWPRTFAGSDGATIAIYHPQPDSIWENKVLFRCAFSIIEKGKTIPQFGSFQALANLETDRRGRRFWFLDTRVLVLRYSVEISADQMEPLKQEIEKELSGTGQAIALDELVSASCLDPDQYRLHVYGELNYAVPRVRLATSPSILVYIDGIPRMKWHKEWGVRVVVNTPFMIAESEDHWYYLYGGRSWYIAALPTGPYFLTRQIPQDLQKMGKSVEKFNRTPTLSYWPQEGAPFPEIIVCTVPTELIQTKGAPLFKLIPGTSLYYVSNSPNDIFLDSAGNGYYTLLSGRWYHASELTGNWQFIRSDSLPGDFARIPEGSSKGNVLSCVAGTTAASEALMDARLPQTARIDRKTLPEEVVYDGGARFVPIRGIHLEYALNTAAIVIRDHGNYFYVDRGVWFCSEGSSGPWRICTKRPEEVALIPPDYPVYLCKFVQIYEANDNFVSAGFTVGYLNSFIDGPAITYGTGFTYRAWQENNYYPCPQTWGFDMHYDLASGWCLGYEYGPDLVNTGLHSRKSPWYGGWWGPSAYQPSYIPASLPITERAAISTTERIYTDRKGNIYRRGTLGNWQIEVGGQWNDLTPQNNEQTGLLDRQEYLEIRGEAHARNLKQAIVPYSQE